MSIRSILDRIRAVVLNYIRKRQFIENDGLMDDFQYIRQEDREEYQRFCAHHLQSFGRSPVAEIWHYTNAQGLIGILKTGRIWSTQVSCLNDSLEQRYFGSQVLEKLRQEALANTNPDLEILFRLADHALANTDFATAWHFVACFSDVEDDLGQWRGYGGGECGFSIGFSVSGILDALKRRPGAWLLPSSYSEERHSFFINDLTRMAQDYFMRGINRGVPDKERWAREFIAAFSTDLDIFASLIKHPKFLGEQERRIATTLKDGEHVNLEFSQKRTLLARHLPIDITLSDGISDKLPITQIYVGPGIAQRVSQVSAGDLLKKYGYEGVEIKLSKVPYRIP